MSLEQQFGELTRQFNLLRQDFDNLVGPEVGAWQDWTPVVRQFSVVTADIDYARYIVMAQAVHMEVRLTITGSGTGGNAILISGIPTTAQPVNIDVGGINAIGSGFIFDNGSAYFQGTLSANSAASWQFNAHGPLSAIGITPNFALAANDVISFVATYER